VSWMDEIQEGRLIEFPVLQMAAALVKSDVRIINVTSIAHIGDHKRENKPLLEITGSAHRFTCRLLADDDEYLDWINGALLCAGMVKPYGLDSLADRLAQYDDVIVGVDTNILYSSILSEHLLDALCMPCTGSYKESINWVLLIIPGVVMKELENAANQKKGGYLTHVGRRGYRALQEIMVLKSSEGFSGLSVLVAGQTNPEQMRLTSDGLTILNADSLIRDQYKAFLKGIDFHKGTFFLTMDKTIASLAAAEGINVARVQHPRRLRKGFDVTMPPGEEVLLARVLYELAVEFGEIRVSWRDKNKENFIDLDGGWQWKNMEHWESWQILCQSHSQGFHKAIGRLDDGRVNISRLTQEWRRFQEENLSQF